MSAEEADKTTTTDASAGDEEEEWLYGDESESKEEDEEAKLNAAVSAPADMSTDEAAVDPAQTTGNGVASEATGEAAGEDGDSDSDSDDDDDDVRVTIGDIKTGAPQYTTYGAPPVNLNIKSTSSRPYGQVTTKLKGVDLDAPGNINGVPVVEVDMESFEEKPWRKPGADLSDYFNYGFNEDTWKAYCEKQKRLRMGLEVSTVGSVTSKITVQQGRTGNEKDMSSLSVHTSKADFTSPVSLYKPAISQVARKQSGTIDVIGVQTATISRVEGRRRHNLEGNNIQVISEHSTTEAEPAPAKIPAFFPPGPLPPNIPPPPFLPPLPNVSTAPPLIPPPRLPITVPPPGFPPPTSGPPPSLLPTMDSSHAGVYNDRPVPPYAFPQGAYPPPIPGSVPPPWAAIVDNAKPWEYYPRREDKRDKDRDRPRERPHERERDREHSPSAMNYNSDEERYRYRDYQERGYVERHRDRSSREKEERHRERRHREKEEGRHKSSRSSSRRRHDSEEGDSHRRHKHKKSKRSKEGKEASDDIGADQENQEAME
ncbi:pre-mRNA 3'-end-processing factor FIP1 isoform X1 [Kryptolebias marmoratus]|uniref:pre-mRNA 3'-end-processing factor FIP1 isoform X1 n=1 Tax=Kryptolebias marmoratus TaxID=37003 RepID=UPI0007F9228D|nr:pre-mRNA 3'-end-processing factor FIP1 isoform X1 [Kryptolebias marmoratus]